MQHNRFRTDRTWFFVLESAYLVVLAIIFIIYQVSAGVRGRSQRTWAISLSGSRGSERSGEP